MLQLVTIFGGSGFVGRYIARRMAKQGWRVKVAVRRPNDALFVKTYGVVGQVEPVFCNIRDDSSVAEALKGADVVVNCVGVLAEVGKNRFQAVQSEGAARIARLAVQEGVDTFVQLSAIGADEESDSLYCVSKAMGEAAILGQFPEAVILRPSVIFGPEDQFFNWFASLTRISPFLPLVGAETKFQPVYVDDVAQAAELAVLGRVSGGVYEIGGPDIASFKSLMECMLTVTQRKSIVLPIPMFAGRVMATAFDAVQFMTLGILKNGVVTRDQVKNLARDNIVSGIHKTFADLDIEPTALDAVLPDYLWPYRPSGQFAEIKDSAKNMRSNSRS